MKKSVACLFKQQINSKEIINKINKQWKVNNENLSKAKKTA